MRIVTGRPSAVDACDSRAALMRSPPRSTRTASARPATATSITATVMTIVFRFVTSVPDPKFVAKVPGAAPGSRGATSEHMAYM